MKKFLLATVVISIALHSFSQGILSGPSSPRFLLRNPSALSVQDHNIKGKPYSITTSSAKTKLDWGKEVLVKQTSLDSIIFDVNGTPSEFYYTDRGMSNEPIHGVFHISNKLDSISIYELYDGEIRDKLYTISYNWIRQDSLILNFIHPDGELVSKMMYSLKPNEVSVTTFRTSESKPEISITKLIGSEGFMERKGTLHNSYLELGKGAIYGERLWLPPFITDEFGKSGLLPKRAKYMYDSDHSVFNMDITKDEQDRIIKITPSKTFINQIFNNAHWPNQPTYATYGFIYDNNDNVIKEIVTIYEVYYQPQKHWEHKVFENTYDYIYDEYENWTQVHFTSGSNHSPSSNEHNSRESYYMVRDIVYYDSPEYEKYLNAEIMREEEIRTMVEQPAEFPGGEASLMRWLSANVMYPADAHEEGVSGKVIISFVVEKDGSVTNPEVQRSPDERLSQEAIRLIEKMPKWAPAKNSGHQVRFRQQIPIMFKSQNY